MTGDLREAERLARRYAVEVDDVLDQIEQKQQATSQPFIDEDIRLGAELMRASLFSADEQIYNSALSASLENREIERRPGRQSQTLLVRRRVVANASG